MTIEQLLSTKGYSQQEITDLAPMLANNKFRKDLEEELGKLEKATVDLNEYDRWYTQEITPEHLRLVKERDDAVATAAAEKARMEAYQRTSQMRQAGKTEAEIRESERIERERVAAEAASKVDTSKFVTSDTFQRAFDATGEAMAVATNIVSNHMQLFPGQFVDMEQLQRDAKAARKPVKQFWEEKYNVAGRRQELANKAKEDERAAIRKEEREKMIVEFGGSNPNLQVMAPSHNPFVIRKAASVGKQPWERTENEMQRERIEKAIQNAAKRGEMPTA